MDWLLLTFTLISNSTFIWHRVLRTLLESAETHWEHECVESIAEDNFSTPCNGQGRTDKDGQWDGKRGLCSSHNGTQVGWRNLSTWERKTTGWLMQTVKTTWDTDEVRLWIWIRLSGLSRKAWTKGLEAWLSENSTRSWVRAPERRKRAESRKPREHQ